MTMLGERVFGLGGALVLLGTWAAAPPSDGALTIEAIDTAEYPMIEVVVSASPGLDFTADPSTSLTLTENGVERELTAERVPVDDLQVMLVIDTSESMEGAPIDAARDAATSFVDAMPGEVPIGLADGGDSPEVLLAPTADHDAVRAAVAGLDAFGETSVYDAVVAATDAFLPERSDRVMLLLSDGGDTVSSATLADAAAAAADVRVLVVALSTGDANRVALEQIAGASDAVVSVADTATLEALYRDAAGAISNRYVIVYESLATGSTEITVRLVTTAGELSVTESVVVGETTSAPTASAPTPTVPTTEQPLVEAVPPPPPTSTTTPTFVVQAAPDLSRATGSTGLWIGAILAFGAIVAAALVIAPSDPARRLGRRQLGVRRSSSNDPSAVSQKLSDLTNRAIERTGQRGRISGALEAAGYNLRAEELVTFTIVGAALAGGIAQLTVGSIAAIALFVLVPVLVALVVRAAAARRRREFVDVLPEVLQLMVGALRSGYGLMQTIDAVSQQAPEPARSEFRRVMFETRVGRDPGDALRALAARMRSQDTAWVVTAIEINRDVGGDLAQTMETVAETIRERQRLHRQIHALTAEGRISAYILAILPFALGGVLALIHPDYFEPLTHGVGLGMFIAAVVLVVIGIVWMQRIVKAVGGAT